MRRLTMVGGLLGLVAGIGLVAGSPAFAAASKAAPGANFPSGTYDISFDGFCDGMQITSPGSAGAPGVQAVRTGSCQTPTPLFGSAGPRGVGMADATYTLYAVINANHTWAYYMDCGVGQECVAASGTWSYGAPAAPAGSRPSTAGGLFGMTGAGAAAAQRLPGPKVSGLQIAFDGYCDGMALNIPGSAGTPGADGMETGCQTNPLIGAGTASAGFVGMWDYTAGFFYVVRNDQSWLLYVDCGDGTECLQNSGTWSFGSPVAPQGKRTAVASSLKR